MCPAYKRCGLVTTMAEGLIFRSKNFIEVNDDVVDANNWEMFSE